MDINEFRANQSRFPPEQLEKYYGQHVAWSLDGKRILAGGADDLQVVEAVKAAGYDPEQVLISYVPFPDEIILGGALLFQDEVNS